jgi:hypothetical protein
MGFEMWFLVEKIGPTFIFLQTNSIIDFVAQHHCRKEKKF